MTHTTKGRKARSNRIATLNRDAAGIDIGSKFHVVAVPADRDEQSVRCFDTFTGELNRLADWLQQCRIKTVALESTGIYWIPLYAILEDRGIEVLVVNARDVKHVPGRKTDVNDAQWLQQLHECGLLRGSFHPPAQVARLRAYLRQRERLLDYAAAHVQHMQKALMQMNLQLHYVVADITGKTGMAIIKAILAGAHDPLQLASLRDRRCKESEQTIAQALEGDYRAEHLLALTQALSLYELYQQHVAQCDQAIEQTLTELLHDRPPPSALPPKVRRRGRQRNEPQFDIRLALFAVLGVDLTQIHGIGPFLALRLVAECGTDMSKWPSAKHFTSWICLAPGNKISGGKVLSSHTRRTSNRVTSLLRLAAVTVGKTDSALGAFYRRLSARVGKSKAITATARKLAVLFYNTLRYGLRYDDPGASYYDEQHRQRVLDNLARRAKQLGYTLAAQPQAEVS